MTPALDNLESRLRNRRGVLVDSNVLLDVATNDAQWADWSAHALAECADCTALIINPIVYAEVSIGFSTIEALDAALPLASYAAGSSAVGSRLPRRQKLPELSASGRPAGYPAPGLLHWSACGHRTAGAAHARRGALSDLFPEARNSGTRVASPKSLGTKGDFHHSAEFSPFRCPLIQPYFHSKGFISMFKELAPLLRHRAVLFTVSHVEDDQFRVNVIPKKLSGSDNDALTTPVSVTGTAEDLDTELPQTLLHFVSSHLELKNSLERAKAEMEEASKAARSEARKKSGSQITKKEVAGNSNKPVVVAEVPAPAKAEPPKAASLFDSAPVPARSCGPDGPPAGDALPALAAAETDEDDEEILREAYDEGEGEEGDEAA